MNYLGIPKPRVSTNTMSNGNIFNRKNYPAQSLGAMIRDAVQYGSELPASAVVQYDDPDSADVDVLTSPDHDFHDIAEQFGHQASAPAAPAPTEGQDPAQSE